MTNITSYLYGGHGYGDKALALLRNQCANVSPQDTKHFNHDFTNLRINYTKSATHFMQRFTLARTMAEQHLNTYADATLVDLFLIAISASKSKPYEILQLFPKQKLRFEEGSVTFDQVEEAFLKCDDNTDRETRLSKGIARGNAAITTDTANNVDYKPAAKKFDTRQTSDPITDYSNWKCYSCNEMGHISKDYTNPKKSHSSERKPVTRGKNGGGR